MKIEILNKAETEILSILIPKSDDPNKMYEDGEYVHNVHGPATCTFTVKRDTQRWWEDLEDSNIVKVYAPDLKWEGEIEEVDRESETESALKVGCSGLINRLKQNGTNADVLKNLMPGEKLSTYIVDHILPDANLGYTAGTIETTDFAITSGREFFPGKNYAEILDDGNQFSGWDW